MAKLTTYSIKGTKKKNKVAMPKSWQENVNKRLLAQAIRVYEDRKHLGFSKTKTRGEIRASTRKIYRQKGLGLARHGAISAPIFVGGSKAHGPKGLNKELSLPKKMKRKALRMALSYKAERGEILVVDGVDKLKKTKEAAVLMDKVIKKEKILGKSKKFTFALSKKNKNAALFIRNLGNTEIVEFRNLNAYDVFFAGVLVIDKDALGENKGGKSKKKSKKKKNKRSTNTKTKTKKKSRKKVRATQRSKS